MPPRPRRKRAREAAIRLATTDRRRDRAPSPAAFPGHGSGGQGLVEYGLILGLSAALAVVVLVFLGGTLGEVLDAIARSIDEAT